MELSKKTVKYLSQDIHKYWNEFDIHPIPKCIFLMHLGLWEQVDDETFVETKYEVAISIKKLTFNETEENKKC